MGLNSRKIDHILYALCTALILEFMFYTNTSCQTFFLCTVFILRSQKTIGFMDEKVVMKR